MRHGKSGTSKLVVVHRMCRVTCLAKGTRAAWARAAGSEFKYKLYYETASWRLAQTMRRGVAFKAAADEILGDTILWQDTMAKVVHENPDKPAKKRPWEPEKPYKGGKGGRGGGKGRQQKPASRHGKQRYWFRGDPSPARKEGGPAQTLPGPSPAAAKPHTEAPAAAPKKNGHRVPGDEVILLSFFDGIGAHPGAPTTAASLKDPGVTATRASSLASCATSSTTCVPWAYWWRTSS